jgi:rod shape determining protein RodA
MKREFWRYFDFWLFGAVLVLCIFGIVMIRSAVAGSLELVSLNLVARQSIYVGAGLVIILGMALIDYRYWASLTRVMYIGTVGFLIVIFVVGSVAFGSARWLDTGLIFIQPSELAKIIVILVLANFFSQTWEDDHNLRWLAKGLLLTFGVVLWILLQPNLSTSIVMMVLWFSMAWFSGLPTRYMLVFAGIGLIGLIIFITLVSTGVKIPFLQDYQLARIVNFVFPDPEARHGNAYNVEQALITIGSGGLFGQGYGHSSQVQLRYLKVRHTDFIFSAMAAEFGFVGTVLVIVVLIFIIIRCLRTARLAPDRYGALIAYGIATLLFFQTAVNIGVNLNVIPVTGLTLPFVSYGGSSLVSLVVGIGLVESVAARRKPKEF